LSPGEQRASHANAFGATGNGTTISNGAALGLSGGISFGAEALSLTGSGISSTGALRNISGNNAYGGADNTTISGAMGTSTGTFTKESSRNNLIHGAQELCRQPRRDEGAYPQRSVTEEQRCSGGL
jgi:hypothetical protein